MAKKHWFLEPTSGKLKGCRLIMRNGIRIHARLLKPTCIWQHPRPCIMAYTQQNDSTLINRSKHATLQWSLSQMDWYFGGSQNEHHQSGPIWSQCVILSWFLIFTLKNINNSVNYVLNLFIFGHKILMSFLHNLIYILWL